MEDLQDCQGKPMDDSVIIVQAGRKEEIREANGENRVLSIR
jgi:hypothetical protein